MAISPEGFLFAGTDGGGMFRSINRGEDWIQINNGLADLDIWTVAINRSGHIFAGTYTAGAYRSTDDGDTWVQLNSPWLGNETRDLAIDSSGYIFAGTGDLGFYRSTDSGDTWAEVNNGLDALTEGANLLDVTPSGVLFAATQDGVFRSYDHGNMWERTLPRFTYEVNFLFDSVVFAGTGDQRGIFRSTDFGDNWTLAGDSLEFVLFGSFVVVSQNNVFAASKSHGVYRTSDLGNNWYEENEGLINNDVYGFVRDSEGYLFAGTFGGGVFRTMDPITYAVEHENGVPGSFSLSQNYPNPFNPTTTIRYTVSRDSYVSLKMFDLLGQRVATLVDGRQMAGQHAARWDGSNDFGQKVASGVYFYRMIAGTLTESRRMLLLK
jgi:photosystem II stability/assembly factor-like uncharacterized protein